MTCEAIRQLLLSLDMDPASRQRVAEALSHVNSCQACHEAMRDFDRLSGVLRTTTAGFAEARSDALQHGDEPSTQPPELFFEQTSPAGGWAMFEEKLLAAATGAGRSRPVFIGARRWISALAGLAAMLLVGWAAFQLGRKTTGDARRIVQAPETAPAVAMVVGSGLSPDEVARRVRAFDAIDRSFNGQTRWLMFSADNAEIGLSDQVRNAQAPTTRGAKVLLVRLNLVRGAEVVSKAELLIVAGTTANVVVRTEFGPVQYHIVTCASDPMQLSVQLQVPQEPGGIATTVAPNGSQAILGTHLELKPYMDASAGRLVFGHEAFDLQVAAASSDLPGS